MTSPEPITDAPLFTIARLSGKKHYHINGNREDVLVLNRSNENANRIRQSAVHVMEVSKTHSRESARMKVDRATEESGKKSLRYKNDAGN